LLRAKAHVVNGKIYLVDANGGLTGSDNRILEYDPATEVWEIKSSIPTYRSSSASIAVGTKIYIFGGVSAEGDALIVDIYDVVTEQWTQGMPSNRRIVSGQACVAGEKIYLISNKAGSVNMVFDVYDPSNDSWELSMDTTLPPQNSTFSCVNVGDYFYMFSDDVAQRYHVQNNDWEVLIPMPKTRDLFSVTAIDDQIYILGGVVAVSENGGNAVVDRVDVFDTTSLSQ